MSLSAQRVSTGHSTGKSELVKDRSASFFADGFPSPPVCFVDSYFTSVSRSQLRYSTARMGGVSPYLFMTSARLEAGHEGRVTALDIRCRHGKGAGVRISGAVLERIGAPRPYAASKPITLSDLDLASPGPGEL